MSQMNQVLCGGCQIMLMYPQVRDLADDMTPDCGSATTQCAYSDSHQWLEVLLAKEQLFVCWISNT